MPIMIFMFWTARRRPLYPGYRNARNEDPLLVSEDEYLQIVGAVDVGKRHKPFFR